jgi:hypothetical protein
VRSLKPINTAPLPMGITVLQMSFFTSLSLRSVASPEPFHEQDDKSEMHPKNFELAAKLKTQNSKLKTQNSKLKI